MTLRDFYKTSSLSGHGRFLLIAVLVLMLAGPWLIPEFKVDVGSTQWYTQKGKHFKYNDVGPISRFLQSVKKEDSYLVLGTSESIELNGGNYYRYLDYDPEQPDLFSYLAGAGRTCGKHIPMLLNHREIVDSLKVIYFINPVYWSKGLSKPNKEYWNRYNNYAMLQRVKMTEEERIRYYQEIEASYNKINWAQKIQYSAEYWLREWRKPFFQDLNWQLDPEAYLNDHRIVVKGRGHSRYPNFGKVELEKLDSARNVDKSYQVKTKPKPIDVSTDYRYRELTSFIHLCQDLNVEVTYILGPYNERYFEAKAPEILPGFETCSDSIRQILQHERVDFIDATDISPVIGAFTDKQHHSSYGAYLIYQKIKQHLHEKNRL